MNKILHPKYPITHEEFNHRYWEMGQSMEHIARGFNGWGSELHRYTLKAGLRLKTKRQAYDDRMRSGANRKYFFNDAFFNAWSPAMAWVLGLIASDGCIHKGGHYWQITLADLDCLEQVAALVDYNGPIIKSSVSACHVLKVAHVFMVRRLLEIGLTPRKSLTLKYPEMPNDMHRHFIRGYFDGDGNINTQKPRSKKTSLVTARVTLSSGSGNFSDSLMLVLSKAGMEPHLQVGKPTVRTFPDGHTSKCKAVYAVRVSSFSAARFFEYIYNDVPENLSMKRKRDKYTEWYVKYGHVYARGTAPKGYNAMPVEQMSLGI